MGSEKSKTYIRIGLAVAGVGLFVFGIFNGGMADVLTKAINICTQCIGLG
ncbi:MAG: thioredoxin [Clostridia bacterium]|nr:thioredoxin [Clostridia bacterium]